MIDRSLGDDRRIKTESARNRASAYCDDVKEKYFEKIIGVTDKPELMADD